ncbi:MAG: hypothetical protein FWD84_06975 [Oscillospiraceae bacterium]|nr:hypothetical protein [Oscillospiraceae bacterium]
MKKMFIFIVLAILLVGALTACSQDTTIEDYLALEAEFRALEDAEEGTATLEMTFDLHAVDGAVLTISATQAWTQAGDAVLETQHTRDERGNVLFETSVILIDDVGYTELDSFMPVVMDALRNGEGMEGFSPWFDDVSYEDIIDDYLYLTLPDEVLEDIQARETARTEAGLHGIFTEESLDMHLSRNEEGVFRIEVAGEAVDAYLEAALNEIGLENIGAELGLIATIVDMDDDLLAELEADFVAWLRAADLTDARLILARSKSGEDTYHQTIELSIPERVFIAFEMTVVLEEVAPITAPDRFLTDEELSERLGDWLVGGLLESLQGLGTDVAPDPIDLADSELLEPHTITSVSGETYTVPLIRNAEWSDFDYDVAWSAAGAIELEYWLVPDYEVLEGLGLLEEEVESILAGEDPEISIDRVHPVMQNADGRTVLSGWSAYMWGEYVTLFQLVRDIPNSDYTLILNIYIHDADWTANDTRILSELGRHFGVDFMRYV